MRFSQRLFPLAACGMASAIALGAPAPAPQDAGLLLIREGDVLSNGWTARTFLGSGIADDGRWAALVDTDQVGGAPSKAIVLEGGVVLLAEDQLLPSGERVGALVDLSVDPAGLISTVLNVDVPAGVPTESRLYLGPTLALKTGDPVFGNQLPGPSSVFVIRDVESAYPFALVEVDLKPVGGLPYKALLRLDYSSGSAVTTVIAREGLTLSGGQAPVGTAFFQSAIDGDGSYLTSLGQSLVAPNDITVALRDGVTIFAEGTAAPLGGNTWEHFVPPTVAKAAGASYMFSSTLRSPSAGIRGIVLVSGAILALEGNSLFGAPGLIAANFQTAAVAQAQDGTGFYKVPVTTGSVMMGYRPGGGAKVLLQSGVDRFEGLAVASVKTAGRANHDVTGDGREVLTEVELVGGISALVLVEHRFGFSFACNAQPNSTGVPGELEVSGSSFLSVNHLTLEASSLPLNAFGYLGCSTTPAFVPGAGGSTGNLCLGGQVGRFVQQIASTGSTGTITTAVDLTAIPQPTGFVGAVVGDTWRFQLWHRDVGTGGGPPTSNFTKGRGVVIR